jgi:hypothetical protein
VDYQATSLGHLSRTSSNVTGVETLIKRPLLSQIAMTASESDSKYAQIEISNGALAFNFLLPISRSASG